MLCCSNHIIGNSDHFITIIPEGILEITKIKIFSNEEKIWCSMTGTCREWPWVQGVFVALHDILTFHSKEKKQELSMYFSIAEPWLWKCKNHRKNRRRLVNKCFCFVLRAKNEPFRYFTVAFNWLVPKYFDTNSWCKEANISLFTKYFKKLIEKYKYKYLDRWYLLQEAKTS